ncbi:MAG TPA: hypothetical protein VK165_18915, partial [Azonexus sp.]|nr:hypothetical protein [Azonexus sp.]
VGAANGVATGRLAHVNGVADVVNDGLANSRKAIILVNEAGSTWYVYHPELTAGKLLYFTTSAETTDATISSVTSSGFTVAASLPTGTYRWISMAESEGFLKLTKTVGNGAADGFSDYAALQPAALFQKPINGVGNWSLFDNARDKQNIASGWLIPNTTSGESTLAAFDLNSNGVKCRYAGGSDINTAATIYAQILIAAFPFRYANAR